MSHNSSSAEPTRSGAFVVVVVVVVVVVINSVVTVVVEVVEVDFLEVVVLEAIFDINVVDSVVNSKFDIVDLLLKDFVDEYDTFSVTV